MSHRREQLESSLHRAIAELITEGLADPRIRGLVSVTGVKVSPDNHYADVGISVLPDTAQALSVQGLEAAAGHLRLEVERKLRIRTVPQLRFHEDLSLKKQAEIFGAIRKGLESGAATPDDTAPEDRTP